MSEDEPQSEGMKALEQSLNDHMEICRLQRKAKRLKADNARLKAEVERLRKAGDAVALDYAERIEIEAGETAKTLMKTLPVLRDWSAAKEGNGQP